MNRLIEYTVFSGLVTACRFATCPTRRSSVFVIATTDGVVRPPSWLGITTGSPPCITATTELVVPKSIPIILLIAAIPPAGSRCTLCPPLPYQNEARRHSIPCSPAFRPEENIQLECLFVKFSYNKYNPLRVNSLRLCSRFSVQVQSSFALGVAASRALGWMVSRFEDRAIEFTEPLPMSPFSCC